MAQPSPAGYRFLMDPHDEALSKAFDGQAPMFEKSALVTDAAALARLVAFAALPQGAMVLDAGCGPGLVAEAFLAAGYRVTGVDLSAEMVARARARCARFGERARFEHGPLEALLRGETFDAAVSRLVVHHVPDPLAFVRAQVARVRPGGAVVASDHVADPEAARARWHQEIEVARDRTHTRNLTTGELADLFARAGLAAVSLAEETATLDFDEWFDRGTPGRLKEEVRRMLLSGTARAFEPVKRPEGGVTIRCVRALVRGVKPV
jgi:2-polyprenyl-3-methyl-5-hydroxy-6-metoxy-1,4-benzoquinol methylase